MAGNDKYKCPSATLHQIAQNKWKIFHEQKKTMLQGRNELTSIMVVKSRYGYDIYIYQCNDYNIFRFMSKRTKSVKPIGLTKAL